MELIIDFYKGLDTLNLIIFWGIIIVIVLLLIFSFILINKNKKLKLLVDKNNKYEEELPIKKEEPILEKNINKTNASQKDDNILSITKEEMKEYKTIQQNIVKPIETEKKFVAEEHVMEYNKDLFSLSHIKKANEYKEEKTNYDVPPKEHTKMTTGPYQRNVLREMSLSQTSPIGINRQTMKEDKKLEIAKDLEESLNTKKLDTLPEQTNINKELTQNKITEEFSHNIEVNNELKKELTNIENSLPRKTEIKSENIPRTNKIYDKRNIEKEEVKTILTKQQNTIISESTANELLNREPQLTKEKVTKSSSEKYLEEVSRKLAEAEIPDEIERTNYELKQEEDAIISYKELMEKKDSIQTVDEEEAVISIEELMNLSNQKQENIKEDGKLYKLSDEEENDNFIKELKQFRNDL